MIQIALMALAAKKLGTHRIAGIARTSAYCGVVMVAAGTLGMHKARAAAVETGFRVGEDLAAVAPMLEGASTLNVNGQRIHFAASTTLDGASVVLDKFQKSCQIGEGGDAPVWSSVPTDEQMKATGGTIKKMPVIREDKPQGGFIACLVSSDPMSMNTLKSQITGFVKNHSALQIGKLRYATVHESPTGSSVITVWSDENFDLAALIPDPKQDKPGTDPAIMMRPDQSTRMLSGLVESMPYKVFLYESKQSPKEAIDAYDTKMMATGWAAVTAPQMVTAPHEGFEARSYIRDGFIGYVTTSVGPTGGTLIGLGETASPTLDKHEKVVGDADGF